MPLSPPASPTLNAPTTTTEDEEGEEEDPAIKSRSTNLSWYAPSSAFVGPNARAISAAGRALLENYSGIAPEDVVAHVLEIRRRAWAHFPYPCIGQLKFLSPEIALSPLYPFILSRLISDPSTTLLDLGCCFAQDIRQLVLSGAPPASLYACDLRPEFLELGFELFRDRGTLVGAHFFVADVLGDGEDASVSSAGGGDGLRELEGKIDVVYAANFLHLFGWEDQVRVCKRIVRLLRPRKGSLVFGRQVGDLEAGEYRHPSNKGGVMLRHDGASFERMWRLVGEETGTRWGVRSSLVGGEMEWREWMKEGRARRLVWEVEREE